MLSLVLPFEELLHRLKAQQDEYRKQCGRSYCTKYMDYIYVNEIGELIKPGYIIQHFPLVLKKNGMRVIRFHDLRTPMQQFSCIFARISCFLHCLTSACLTDLLGVLPCFLAIELVILA